MTTLRNILLPCFLVFAGCSASQEKPAIDVAMSQTELRGQTFEATARTLDEHPEYVDEFYQVAGGTQRC